MIANSFQYMLSLKTIYRNTIYTLWEKIDSAQLEHRMTPTYELL